MAKYSYKAEIIVNGGTVQTSAAVAAAIKTAVDTLTSGVSTVKAEGSNSGMNINVAKVHNGKG